MTGKHCTVAPPVAIGGIGGSGTRMVAEILRSMGYYLGDDLNEASDNLWFTLLFKRTELWGTPDAAGDFDRAVASFRAAMLGDPLDVELVNWVRGLAEAERPQHDRAWLQQRVDSLVARSPTRAPERWGWKEPNTHLFLDRLERAFEGLKYIHVVRNGLDMAHSANQNQLRLWGPALFGRDDYEVSPRWSLKYWCVAQRRVAATGDQMCGRFLMLDYDRFCSAPEQGLQILTRFLGFGGPPFSSSGEMLGIVRPSKSIGRFKQFGLSQFDPEDVAYVHSLGFDTACP